MRRNLMVALAVVQLATCISVSHAGKNEGARVRVSTIDRSVGGEIRVPLTVSEATAIRAIHVTIMYDGIVTDVRFSPGDYLKDVIMVPIRHDKNAGTITFAVARTGPEVTRADSGDFGTLIFSAGSSVESARVIYGEFVDDKRRLDKYGSAVARGAQRDAGAGEPGSFTKPAKNKLYQSHPNPANPNTTIAFDLKAAGPVTLRIYDVRGQLVRTLVDRELDSRTHDISWDGLDHKGNTVPSGVYFYRLVAGSFVEQRKLVILK